MPAAGPFLADLTDTRLANGLRVLVHPDDAVPVVAVNLWYAVGSRHEPPGRSGFAHLFEHLMFEGSAHVAKGEHFRLVNAAGGTLNATTWCDRTNYFDTVPSNHLELVLWLEADRMGGLLPALTQETLDNQRDVVKNERRQRMDNQPYGSWSERMHAAAFPPGHPYHHATIGTLADLDAATLDDVRGFYLSHYGPDNAVLSVTGDADPSATVGLVERYFGGIPPRRVRPEPPAGDLPARLGGEVTEQVADRVPLPRLFMGYRCPPFGGDGYDTVSVLAAVLGSGRGSRLFRELVLRRQLAQPAGGSFTDTWGLVEGASLLVADVTARTGVAEAELVGAYDEVVDELAGTGPEPDEVARAQAMLVSEWAHRTATLDGRADLLSQYATLLGDPRLVADQPARWQAVDRSRLRAAAAELLMADNRVRLAYQPADG